MRPDATDIAAPEFPPTVRWLGESPKMATLTAAGPVLVHFVDLAQVNSARALPYVVAWHERYARHGLATVGVHTARFPSFAKPDAAAAIAARLGIAHPLAIDSEHEIWTDYGCEGWPSLFLWGQGGALRWFHFGEGAYAETELAIQEALLEADPSAKLPEPLPPLRATDAEGATVLVPTGEVFPGGSASEPWVAAPRNEPLRIDYEAGGAFVTLEGEGELQVNLDGERRTIAVDVAGLYELASHDRHEHHSLELQPAPGQRVYSVSFAPGVP